MRPPSSSPAANSSSSTTRRRSSRTRRASASRTTSPASSGDGTALDAFVEGDAERADRVVKSRDLDARCAEVERACVRTIALQNPVAGDLRFLLSSFAVAAECRGLSALADRFGQYALATDGGRFGPVDVRALSELAVGTLGTAVDAYRRLAAADGRDSALADDDGPCYGTVRRGERLDRFCANATEALARSGASGESGDAPGGRDAGGRLVATALAVGDLRRVGIHAVTIAGRVLYAATSDDGLTDRYDTRRASART
ncbi:phosphate uptake regulator PhoU [Halomarina pelagica]|uniref:phosphate signaling complex PhoU family protein n=1 Tax=Halomarina pelagica TaxID=2961599 RepID=UPI0034A2C5CD